MVVHPKNTPKCPFCAANFPDPKKFLKHLQFEADQAYEEEVAARTKLARIEQVIKVQLGFEKLAKKK